MKKDLIDFDPFTRVWTWHYYNPDTDETTIETVQDVNTGRELAQKLRNDDNYTKNGIKKECWHYARLEVIDVMNLLKDGINPYNKAQEKDLMKALNGKYSYLKTTRGRHA